MSDLTRRPFTLPITFALVMVMMLLFFSSQLATQEADTIAADGALEARDMGGDFVGNSNSSNDMPPAPVAARVEEEEDERAPAVLDTRSLAERQAEASKEELPRYERYSAWEYAPDLRVLDVSRMPEGVVRLFFDRPVEPDSVKLSFEAPHRRAWFGEQMLLLIPRTPRHTGSIALEVSEARGTDGALLASAFTWQLELPEAARTAPESGDGAWRQGRELGEGDFGLYMDPASERSYLHSRRPGLTFYTFHQVAVDELERGARFEYMNRAEDRWGNQKISCEIKYLGQDAPRFSQGRALHKYQVTPAEDLPLNTEVRFMSHDRFEAHRGDYDAPTTMTRFTVVERDFRLTASSRMTLFYLDATQPVSSSALHKCVTITPKPRVHTVYFFERLWNQDAKWRYIVDIYPAMPGMTYTVDVKPGCRSELGAPLVGAHTFTETFKDDHHAYFEETGNENGIDEPAIWMPELRHDVPMILEREEVARKPKLPFMTRGVVWMSIDVQRLDEAQFALAAQQGRDSFPKDGPPLFSSPITSVEFIGHSDPNKVVRHELALDALLAPRKSGPLLISYDVLAREGERAHRLMTITDLGLTVQGERAWVTRLSTGAPVAGARVALWDVSSARAGAPRHHLLTDEEGTASFEGVSLQPDEYFTASLDGDVVGTYGERSVSRWAGEEWYVPTFTDLSLYRPGDTVHVHGWIRRDVSTKMHVPESLDDEVRFRLHSPRGEELTCKATLSALGGWGCDVVLPLLASSGEYTATVQLKTGSAQSWYWSQEIALDEVKLRVERQRPPRFGVELWQKGKQIKVLASRHGAGVMAGAKLEYSFFARPITWQSVRHPGFHFGVEGEAKLLTSDVMRSDARGEATLRVPSFAAKGRPMRLEAEVTVIEDGGERVTSRTSWVVLPPKMHGVRVNGGKSYEGEEEVRVEVIALDASGERVEGDGHVDVELLQYTPSITRKVGPAGEWLTSTRDELELVKRCRNMRARRDELPRCILAPEHSMKLLVRASQAGTLLWEEVRDARHARPAPLAGSMRQAPELLLAATGHYAGEQVDAVLRAPYVKGAMALISLYGVRDGERGPREIWHHVLPLTAGSTPLQIPLPADLGQQQVSVQATVIRGRADLRASHPASHDPNRAASIWQPGFHWLGRRPLMRSWQEVDPGRPAFATTHAVLEVMPMARRQSQLVLESSAETLEPGQPLSLSLTLYDAQGRPQAGEAVVMVIDEGALALTAHRHDLPPRRAVPSSSPEVARVHDSRERLVVPDEVGMKANPGGGGLDGGGLGTYRDESLLTAHVSRIQLSESGPSSISLAAPQRLSRYRIVAIATHGIERESFATSERTLRVSKPLQLRPTLPRYLSRGDRFEVSLMLLSERDGMASVSLDQALGLGLTEPEQATQQVSLSADEPHWVSWPVEAIGGVDEVIFAFSVRGEGALAGLEDRLTQTVPLRHVRRDEATRVSESKRVSVSSHGVVPSHGLAFPLNLSSFDVAQGELKVSISQLTLEPVTSRLDYLITYPHGCGEQTSSRLHAVVTALELGEALPKWHAKRAQLIEWVDVGLTRLAQLQRSDGSIPLWPEGSADVWVTYYAAWVLEQARKHPEVEVPDTLREPLLAYIERRIDRGDDRDKPLYRAMGLWALALAGRAKSAQLESMAVSVEGLSPEASALLALALAEHDASSPHIAPLLARVLRDEEGSRSSDDMYGNGSRDLAFRVIAAARLDAPKRQLHTLKKALLESGGSTTQSAAFGAVAWRDLFQKLATPYSKQTKVDLYLGDKLMKSMSLNKKSPHAEFTIPLEKLAAAPADASLYVLSSEQGMRTSILYSMQIEASTREGDRRFWKQLQGRRYLVHADGTRAGEQVTSPLHVGDRVVVHHMISCQRRRRRDLAVTDALPAGLERISTDLATTSTMDRQLLARVAETQPALWPWGEERRHMSIHQESLATGEGLYPERCNGVRSASYLARAATPGTFLMPPVHLEFMYDTEHHALGEAHEPLVILP